MGGGTLLRGIADSGQIHDNGNRTGHTIIGGCELDHGLWLRACTKFPTGDIMTCGNALTQNWDRVHVVTMLSLW